jgi:exopolysaccharide biosynthesis protein
VGVGYCLGTTPEATASLERGYCLRFAARTPAAVMRDGQPLAGLDDTAVAPRTSAGISADGRRLYPLTVDGRSEESQGLTLLELAELMRDLGADDAVNLDGGGSSTLVAREPGDRQVTVQNVPSDGAQRPVPNGVGVFVG